MLLEPSVPFRSDVPSSTAKGVPNRGFMSEFLAGFYRIFSFLISGPVWVGVGMLASFQTELFSTSVKARSIVLEYRQLKNKCTLASSCVWQSRQVVWVWIPHSLSLWNVLR